MPNSPYKGLLPYSEEDSPFFFGRDRERPTIIDNLIAWRLTLFYGASGVGKTSILEAGVAHDLRMQMSFSESDSLAPEFHLVLFRDWRDDPLRSLEETFRRVLRIEKESQSRSFVKNLDLWSTRARGKLLVVLDQFEDYLLYHSDEDGEGTFAVEFPRAINKTDLRVNFLISLREDRLAALDKFKGRIPILFDNRLRLEHLSFEAARAAIEEPVKQLNSQQPQNASMSIEPELVNAVLEQVESGRVTIGDTIRGNAKVAASKHHHERRIETPFLQLVMMRLWDEEIRSGSSKLRLKTFQSLGGAQEIVRRHFDDAISNLSIAEIRVARKAFYHLVTPSGNKVAHAISDLSKYADVPQTELVRVLEKLSRKRILRPTNAPDGNPANTYYEIFHDILAPAILSLCSHVSFIKETETISLLQKDSYSIPVVLFSTNSWLSYKICEKYYNGQHPVFCSHAVGNQKHTKIAPMISSPYDLYCALLREAQVGDHSSPVILDEKNRIAFWASRKQQAGEIGRQIEREIHEIILSARPHDFRPLLYVIPYELVAAEVKVVSRSQQEHPDEALHVFPEEFFIERLHRKCFQILEHLEDFENSRLPEDVEKPRSPLFVDILATLSRDANIKISNLVANKLRKERLYPDSSEIESVANSISRIEASNSELKEVVGFQTAEHHHLVPGISERHKAQELLEDLRSPIIYLAETAADLKSERMQILEELTAHGCRVVGESLKGIGHETIPGQAMDCAVLSIHLVGAQWTPIIETQYEAAKMRNILQVVWISKDAQLVPTDFIQALRNESRSNLEYLERQTIGQMQDIIFDLLRPLPSPSPAEIKTVTKARVYLACSREDHPLLIPEASNAILLKDLLEKEGFEVVLPALSGATASKVRSHNRAKLKQCDAVLLYWGKASDAWVKEQLNELTQAAVWRATGAFATKAIYVTTPDSDLKRGFTIPEVAILQDFGRFSRATLEPFLATLRKN